MKHQKSLATVVNLEDARKQRAAAGSTGKTTPASCVRDDLRDPVRVTLISGTVISTSADDISLEGITLRTSSTKARTLYVPGQFISAGDPPNIEIDMDLPSMHGHLRVQASCQLVCFDMPSPEEVSFTLRFISFVAAGEVILRHFIRLCGHPKTSNARLEADVVEFSKREA